MSNTSFPKFYIFDLDGTLALSEHIKLEATQTVCEQFDIEPITEKEYYDWAGAPTKTIFKEFLEKRGLTASQGLIDQLVSERRKTYAKQIHLIERHEPIVSLLQALSPHYKTALVTTSIREQGIAVVKSLGIEKHFSVMVFGDDVSRNKPDPECYEKAAAELGAQPEECLVFEDSESGITAAERFGAQVVKVTI